MLLGKLVVVTGTFAYQDLKPFGFKMAEYTQKVAQIVADEYKGNAANMWNDGVDYGTIRKRIRKLPGFGAEKAEKLRYMLHYFGHVVATGFTGV